MSEKKREIERKERETVPLGHIVVSPMESSLFVEGLELLDSLNWRPVSRRSEVSSKTTNGGVGHSKGVVEPVVQEVDKSGLGLEVCCRREF